MAKLASIQLFRKNPLEIVYTKRINPDAKKFIYHETTMPKVFEKINVAFSCEVCGHDNPPAEKTCRNHCRKCLCSKHVDNLPGDRACDCQGVLVPIGLDYKGGEPQQIVFRCKKCGKLGRNKIASDDNREKLLSLAGKPIPEF